MPVQQHRRQAGEQPVRNVALVGEIALRLDVAEERYARPHHVHRMRASRHHFQHCFQFIRQPAVRLDFAHVGVQFGLVGQLTAQEQVGNFLEVRVLGEIVDVVAAVGEPGAFLADGAKTGHARCYAGQSAGLSCFAHVILSVPYREFSLCLY